MESYNTTPLHHDPQLWALAKKRASFKGHLTTYLIMSVVFWIIWYVTGGAYYNGILPWPIWPMAGWGTGVLFHYLGAYVHLKNDRTEQEYEKLLRQRSMR